MTRQKRKGAVLFCVLLACVVVIFALLKQRTLIPLARLNDQPCPLPGTGKFLLHDMPSTALVSFPGSGNTWTRYILTTASGILTGAVYNTYFDVVVNNGKQRKAKRLLAVKTHQSPVKTRQSFLFQRCLLLIRNPYDALLAEFNRRGFRSDWPKMHTSVQNSTSAFKNWPGFLSQNMRRWSKLYLGWLADCKPSSRLHVLVYSRMMNNLGHELHDVFRFLNISSITPMVDCAVRYREGDAHRADHSWQKKVAVFTQEQTQALNADIDHVQAALERATGLSFQDFQEWKR